MIESEAGDMITSVGTIGINVRDQQQALEFYTQKLGFQLIRDNPMDPGTDSPRWIEVAPAGAQTHLVLFTPPGHEDRIGTFSGYVFHCDDIRTTVTELHGRGVEFAEDLKQEPWGWWASFKDLDVNTFGLWAPPTRPIVATMPVFRGP